MKIIENIRAYFKARRDYNVAVRAWESERKNVTCCVESMQDLQQSVGCIKIYYAKPYAVIEPLDTNCAMFCDYCASFKPAWNEEICKQAYCPHLVNNHRYCVALKSLKRAYQAKLIARQNLGLTK